MDFDADDDDAGGVNLVLDAPSSTPSRPGAFGTPLAMQKQRFSKCQRTR
jgi:hypothetical protein